MSSENVISALQQTLVDLIELSLQAKQAHWNIRGDNFRSLHLELDEITDEIRLAYDEVAERIVTLGGVADGRTKTIAATTAVAELDGGPLETGKIYDQFEERLTGVAKAIVTRLDAVDDTDPLSGDILIAAAQGLEKRAWMLRSTRG